MRSPSQALVWSAYRRSWALLLVQIAGVVTAVFVLDLALDPQSDSTSLINATDMAMIIGFTFLFITSISRRQSLVRGNSSLGFPYRHEYSQPVSTGTLTLVPLFYFCVLMQLAFFIPGIIVNQLFLNVEVSFLAISFVLFQFTIFPLMLNWWTQNGIASLLGYLITFALIGYDLLIPDFTRIEGTWVIETDSITNYIAPLICTAVMMIVTYHGVKQQRSGEILFRFGTGSFSKGDAAALRDFTPLPTRQCPTESPLRAEIWKERQLNGETRAVVAGLVATASSLVILSIIDFLVPAASSVQFSNVVMLTLPMYLAVCIGLIVSSFGVRYRNGVAKVDVHMKTTPLSTVELTFVRVSVSLFGAVLAGCIFALLFSLLGSLLIEDFQEISSRFWDVFASLGRAGFSSALLYIVLLVVAFLTGLVLLSIVLAWTMLYGQQTAIASGLLCVYVFLLVSGLFIFYGEGEQLNQALDAVGRDHLWLLLLAIPLAIAGMMRALVRGGVIGRALVTKILFFGGVAAGLHLIWLFGDSHYDALSLDFRPATLGYLTMQSFLPLLAVVFALWTTDKLRHG